MSRWLLVACLLSPSAAHAYRPFLGTDAAVAETGVWEVELGAFGASRDAGRTHYITPDLRLNYGISPAMELVAEGVLDSASHQPSRLRGGELSLKALLRPGELQDRTGLSVASESSVLTPDSGGAALRWGAEQNFIFSRSLGGLRFHLNAGAAWDTVADHPSAIAGLIAERPLSRSVRLVGEYDAAGTAHEPADASALLGTIWSSPWPWLQFDAGWRWGLSAAAPAWTVTLGLTAALGG